MNLGPQDLAAMMQGMMTMMQLWNAFSSGGNIDFSGALSPGTGFGGSSWPDPWGAMPSSGMPLTGSPFTSMPWTGAGPRSPGGWPGGPGGALMPRWPSGGQQATPLEGRWQGTAGDSVEFRGDRFRLGAAGRGALSGSFLVHGDRLVAYVPQADATRIYRFELRGSYLALRDESGAVLLFRRASR